MWDTWGTDQQNRAFTSWQRGISISPRPLTVTSSSSSAYFWLSNVVLVVPVGSRCDSFWLLSAYLVNLGSYLIPVLLLLLLVWLLLLLVWVWMFIEILSQHICMSWYYPFKYLTGLLENSGTYLLYILLYQCDIHMRAAVHDHLFFNLIATFTYTYKMH